MARTVLGDFEALDISRGDLWVYLAAPMVGAIVGWLLHKFIAGAGRDFGDHVKAIGRELGPDDDEQKQQAGPGGN